MSADSDLIKLYSTRILAADGAPWARAAIPALAIDTTPVLSSTAGRSRASMG